jgi:hypothetical protein
MTIKTMRQIFFLLLFIPFAAAPSKAQNLTGIWKGYFISDNGDYYKLEFQVAQNGSYGVTGVSCSYFDIRFYGKATMTGSFVKSSSSFKIREIKTVEVKSSMGGGTCIMNYNFKYSKSGKEEFLEGTYLGKFENKVSSATGTWGDCGGGKVYLRRVATTDFYLEPFLKNKDKNKNKPIIVNQPPTKKDTTAKKNPPVTKVTPNTKPPVAKTNPPVTKKPTPLPVVKKPETPPPPVVKTKPEPIKKDNTPPPVIKTNPITMVPKPTVLKNRVNELAKTIIVTSSEVVVKLYDNGEIDDDTISVYLDNKLVLSSKKLTASPLTIKINMDEQTQDGHELVMVAENLGRIPPNTSLMIVEAGSQRFEVRITSTEQKNAVVRFKYQKAGMP